MADESGSPPELLRALGALPSYYLHYYYQTREVLDQQLAGGTRAEDVMAIERELLELYRDPTLDRKPALLESRGGAFYSEAAAQLIASLHSGAGDVQVVDVRNDGALPDLPDDGGRGGPGPDRPVTAPIRCRSPRWHPSCAGSSRPSRPTRSWRSRRPSAATARSRSRRSSPTRSSRICRRPRACSRRSSR